MSETAVAEKTAQQILPYPDPENSDDADRTDDYLTEHQRRIREEGCGVRAFISATAHATGASTLGATKDEWIARFRQLDKGSGVGIFSSTDYQNLVHLYRDYAKNDTALGRAAAQVKVKQGLEWSHLLPQRIFDAQAKGQQILISEGDHIYHAGLDDNGNIIALSDKNEDGYPIKYLDSNNLYTIIMVTPQEPKTVSGSRLHRKLGRVFNEKEESTIAQLPSQLAETQTPEFPEDNNKAKIEAELVGRGIDLDSEAGKSILASLNGEFASNILEMLQKAEELQTDIIASLDSTGSKLDQNEAFNIALIAVIKNYNKEIKAAEDASQDISTDEAVNRKKRILEILMSILMAIGEVVLETTAETVSSAVDKHLS